MQRSDATIHDGEPQKALFEIPRDRKLPTSTSLGSLMFSGNSFISRGQWVLTPEFAAEDHFVQAYSLNLILDSYASAMIGDCHY